MVVTGSGLSRLAGLVEAAVVGDGERFMQLQTGAWMGSERAGGGRVLTSRRVDVVREGRGRGIARVPFARQLAGYIDSQPHLLRYTAPLPNPRALAPPPTKRPLVRPSVRFHHSTSRLAEQAWPAPSDSADLQQTRAQKQRGGGTRANRAALIPSSM